MSKNIDINHRLANDKISRLLLHYTVPSVVGTMVNALYNIVDRIFIGNGVGADAITGLTLTFPISIFILAFGMLVGVGASARVSILLGKGKKEEANKVLANSVYLTVFFHVVLASFMMIYMEDLLRLFGANDSSLPYAYEYLSIIIPCNIFANIAFGYNAIMRSSGYPFKAMITMLIGAVINTILDGVFIYGFSWGIKGAAWATVIATAVSAIWVISHFINPKHNVVFTKEAFAFSKKHIIAICTIGMAPFSIQLVGSLVNIMFNRSFVEYSLSEKMANMEIATFGILNSYAMIAFLLMLGVAQGMQPIVGYNYGARKLKRVMDTFRISTLINLIIAFVFTIMAIIGPRTLAALFTKDEALIDMASQVIYIVMLGFISVPLQVTSTQFFQSIGMSSKSMLLSLSRQVLFQLPLLIILPRYFDIDGIWYALPIADIASGLIAMILVFWQFSLFKKELKLECL